MRVLAVVAHPDDIDILCAGTMARYASDGATVFLCNATSGDRGSVYLSMDEIRAVRDEESRKSAAVIGAEYRCLEFHDGELIADDPGAREDSSTSFARRNPILFSHTTQTTITPITKPPAGWSSTRAFCPRFHSCRQSFRRPITSSPSTIWIRWPESVSSRGSTLISAMSSS